MDVHAWRLSEKQPLTLSGPAFSVVRLARGGEGSEARMPKIKVTINRLKWNFAWVIIATKACLMQNLSLVAFYFWRYDVTKFLSGEGNESPNSATYPPENGWNFKKVSFYIQNRYPRPKIYPHVNFSTLQAEENFFIFKNFLDVSMRNKPLDWSILLKFAHKMS